MKFIALVSGGKDSCFNILKCQQHGHELVALANLCPEASGPDDLDSYCFQTVGHQMLPLYPACMNIPLYRKMFSGTSVARDLQYVKADGDEVEAMHALLAYVRSKHPDVEGVSSGAIASDYQRLRVEHVCGRLGLVSLAYLWHQPQVELLQGMVDAGLHSILVKVASLGLSERHLGKSLAQLQSTLSGLADKYACNACGEGGEYETLTLDGPMFTHGSISLQDSSIHVVDSNAVTTVALLRPESFSVVPKAGAPGRPSPEAVTVHVPHAWTPPDPPPGPTSPDHTDLRRIIASPLNSQGSSGSGLHTLQACGGLADAIAELQQPRAHLGKARPSTSASEHQSHAAQSPSDEAVAGRGRADDDKGPEAAEESAAAVTAALRQIESGLRAAGLDWANVLYVHLFLRSMHHFLPANAAYRSIVPQSSAPARACVAAPLPRGVLCSIDAVAAPAPPPGPPAPARKVLHVQSHSDWAPASVGPYSQATVWHGLLHMAGQIPLDPGSMTITAADDIPRCVRSCGAIATALGCHLPSSLLASVTFHTADVPHTTAAQAAAALRGGPPAADTPHADSSASAGPVGSGGEAEEGAGRAGGVFGVEAGEERGDSYRVTSRIEGTWEPLHLLVEVPMLPKACGVEVQVIAATAGSGGTPESDSQSDDEGAATHARMAGGSWAHSLQSTTSHREPRHDPMGGSQYTQATPTQDTQDAHRPPDDDDAQRPELEHPCAAPAHPAAPHLRVRSVWSAGAMALVQICCGGAPEGGGAQHVLARPEVGTCGGGGGCGGGGAVELLRDIPAVLQWEFGRAGLRPGTPWSTRLFVDCRIAAAARTALGRGLGRGDAEALSELSLKGSAESSTPGPVSHGAGPAGLCESEDEQGSVASWAECLTVTEVCGIRDGIGSVMWAVRALTLI